jgi:spermidine/putrescine transport system permease protein
MSYFKRILVRETPFLLFSPALIWQVVFLYLPIFILFIYSFCSFSSIDNSFVFTFEYYRKALTYAYFKIILNSFVMALGTAGLCLIISFPVAYFLSLKVSSWFRSILIFSLILPSWTSLIVQIYSWFFLLDKNSFLSYIIYKIGITNQPMHLLNNYYSMLIGMVFIYLPFMILPIYSVMERMDESILEASADLGASRFETLKRIIWPMSRPGIYVGFLLVFVSAFGEFAVPILLGGSKYAFWGNLIVDKFLVFHDWKTGASLAIIGMLFPIVIYVFSLFTFKLIWMMKSLKNKKNRCLYNGQQE